MLAAGTLVLLDSTCRRRAAEEVHRDAHGYGDRFGRERRPFCADGPREGRLGPDGRRRPAGQGRGVARGDAQRFEMAASRSAEYFLGPGLRLGSSAGRQRQLLRHSAQQGLRLRPSRGFRPQQHGIRAAVLIRARRTWPRGRPAVIRSRQARPWIFRFRMPTSRAATTKWRAASAFTGEDDDLARFLPISAHLMLSAHRTGSAFAATGGSVRARQG